MNDEQHESGLGWGFLWWMGLAILIYILSIGPAAWLTQRTNNSALNKTEEIVYAPLIAWMDSPWG